MMAEPYYSAAGITLWKGDMRDIIPALGLTADLVVADPPYGETELTWDRWPTGWLDTARQAATTMWCFGSLRTFMGHAAAFAGAGWKLSQDIVGHDEDGEPVFGDLETLWEKQSGSGFHADRFKRVHEWASHWYVGPWDDAHQNVPTTPDAVARQVRSKGRPAHMGERGADVYTSVDGGPRLMRSVIKVRNMHGRAIHPTEKPLGLIVPMLEYGCPAGGTVLDPFAGSGSTAEAALLTGRRALLIEGREDYCERIAHRLEGSLLTGAQA